MLRRWCGARRRIVGLPPTPATATTPATCSALATGFLTLALRAATVVAPVFYLIRTHLIRTHLIGMYLIVLDLIGTAPIRLAAIGRAGGVRRLSGRVAAPQ
jgi:hypothetical protein